MSKSMFAETSSMSWLSVSLPRRRPPLVPQRIVAKLCFRQIVAVTALFCAAALLADMFVLQAYERVLTAEQRYSTVLEPPYQMQRILTETSKGSPRWQQTAKQAPDGLKMVWLMSFPNSGTSFTSRLVRDMTKTDSASNYADETLKGQAGYKLPVYPDMPEGPFWIRPEASPDYTEPDDFVITKTHCGIRCTMCPPEKYAESSYSFRRQCFRTKWIDIKDDGTQERVFSEYPRNRLAKAIHLVRDPFDNIVSRYHLERQLHGRMAGSYPKSQAGFRAYCAAIDDLHKANEKRINFLDSDILELMDQVPCHADFFRYIEWHNLAFVTTRDLELTTYVLHYDWFSTRFNETSVELLEFLNLKMHGSGELTPFLPGKVYPYFTAKEKRAVQKAFEIMASTQTWKHVQHYFDSIDDIPDVREEENEVIQRPALSRLVNEGSKTEIIGDVQFLMDFAIVGYPKTATSTKVRWLAKHNEIQMYDREIYHLKDGEPAKMVRTLYELPHDKKYIRGYKAPRDIHNPRAIDAFAKYWPNTKFIVGLRHPVLWFESFYNFRIRFNMTLPPPNELIGPCPKQAYNVCTNEIRYHDHLSRLGKTDRTNPDEEKLLSSIILRHHDFPKMNNPVFLYEISQMHESDPARAAQYRADLGKYLSLTQPLDPLSESSESHGDHPNKDKEIDICDPKHALVHDELMQIARDSSLWIRNYFVGLPDVFVSSPEHFNALLERWMDDPCVTRSHQGFMTAQQ